MLGNRKTWIHINNPLQSGTRLLNGKLFATGEVYHPRETRGAVEEEWLSESKAFVEAFWLGSINTVIPVFIEIEKAVVAA